MGQVVPIVKRYTYLLDDSTSSGMVFNHKPYYIQGIKNYQAGTVVQPIPSLLSYEVSNLTNRWTLIGTAVDVAITIAGLTSPVGLAIDVGVTLLAPAVADAFQFLFHRTHRYHYDSPSFAVSSTPLNNLFDINGASVSYSEVQVINGDGGKTVNYYTSQQEHPDSASSYQLNCLAKPVKTIYGNTGSYPPNTSFAFERGLLKMSKAYDNNKNLVSLLINTYQLSKRVSSVAGQRSSVSGYAPLSPTTLEVSTYDVGLYKEIAENIQLTQSQLTLYDQDHSGSGITTTHSYTWESNYPTLLHSESTPKSDGKMLINYMVYPMDYAAGTPFIDSMMSHKLLAVPIERVSAIQDSTGISITGGIVSRYKTGGTGLLDTVFALAVSKPIPATSFKFSNQVLGVMSGTNTSYAIDKNYIAKAFYQAYDSKNNLTQGQTVGEPSSSTIWGYNKNIPIAQISNAAINQVAYTSFEDNDQRYWQFSTAGRDSSGLAKMGKIRYQLGSGAISTTAGLPSGAYILSYWTQGTKPTIGGTTADVSIVNGESDNHGWSFYMDRITVSAVSQVTLSGNGLIDELRLYPQGAHISTASMVPQVGVLATGSQDDKVNTIDYDAFQRVKAVRDDGYNILKGYTYSNVAQVPCIDTPAVWIGINPVCYTDQTGINPNINNYSAIVTNSYGNALCSFTRTPAESSYLAKINYTVKFTDSTTYSNSVMLKNGDQSTLMGLPLTGKSAESVMGIGIDTVINFTDDNGLSYQRYQNRKRTRDGYTEANTVTGGLGYYIAPVQSAAGCPLLFTNHAQTGFAKNDCANGSGSVVDYTVAAGAFSGATQFAADSAARVSGQAYANANGNCTAADTSWVGSNPTCVTGTADSGTPSISSYTITLSSVPQLNNLVATLTRSSAEAVHDATVTYQITFIDGSVATYTNLMYKNQSTINFSPPLIGYSPNSVASITVTGVAYSALKRLTYTNRQRLINGVSDGYSEPNTTGQNYLAPLEDPSACNTWYYNTAQTGFYKNNCSTGGLGSQVSYTVPAHTDSSMVSQVYADALARARGQVYANASGNCSPTAYVTTIAGNNQWGYQDGSVFSAEFRGPLYLAADRAGNIYVVDDFTMIRKISTNGTVSTLAGSTTSGFADGVGTAARFNAIVGIAIDASGNIFVADANNNRIRKITPAGVVTTFAGSSVQGHTDGQGTAATLDPTGSLVFDQGGNLYVADYNFVRKITPNGYVSTFAGNISSGYTDGPIAVAQFNTIDVLTIDKFGNIYTYEQNNQRIRKISSGVVSTLAGNGTWGFHDGTGSVASFNGIEQMTTDDAGNIYFGDYGNSCIRKCTPAGVVTTLTMPPPFNQGYSNGPVSSARFNAPVGIMVDSSGNVYETDNNVVRKIIFPH